MLSEEKELPYDRPMLTKNLFGAVSGGAIASVSAKWYQENRINLQLESRVAALDAEKKEVVLTDGTVYPFDKCIYALGAHSFVPPIKGNDLPQVAVVRSIADVERVNALVQDAKNAVVIGGGVLGLEAAWELRRFGLDVTVLESAPVLMAGKIDAPTVRMLTGIAECKGISDRCTDCGNQRHGACDRREAGRRRNRSGGSGDFLHRCESKYRSGAGGRIGSRQSRYRK